MNRWLLRLAELEGERNAPSLGLQHAVQNVQNAQNTHREVDFEHSGHFEHRAKAQRNRAAVIAHDTGHGSRTWDEGVARLNRDRPPIGVPIGRWQRFIATAVSFLHSPFRSIAAALGWSAHDLFGCDGDRPFERIDQSGLLWLLNGDRLVALTSEEAVIETQSGIRQTFRRRPDEVGRVLAWELPSRCENATRS